MMYDTNIKYTYLKNNTHCYNVMLLMWNRVSHKQHIFQLHSLLPYVRESIFQAILHCETGSYGFPALRTDGPRISSMPKYKLICKSAVDMQNIAQENEINKRQRNAVYLF